MLLHGKFDFTINAYSAVLINQFDYKNISTNRKQSFMYDETTEHDSILSNV